MIQNLQSFVRLSAGFTPGKRLTAALVCDVVQRDRDAFGFDLISSVKDVIVRQVAKPSKGLRCYSCERCSKKGSVGKVLK